MLERTPALLQIHIPKTGGTSIATALFPDYAKTEHRLARWYDKETWESHFCFAFVRNPFARTLSHYIYHVKGRYSGTLLDARPHLRAMTFEEYIEAFVAEPTSVQFFSQCAYLIHPTSPKRADFIGRFESLAHDYQELCARIGIVRALPHLLRSTHTHYAHYYTARAKEMVTRAYRDDFEAFGYVFEPRKHAPGSSVPSSGSAPEPLEGAGHGLGARTPALVNAGSRTFSRPGWTNLGVPAEKERTVDHGTDYVHELNSDAPWPFPDAELDAIYCAHVVQRLSDQAAERIFREAFRCLRPRGVLRVLCSDMEHIHRAFVREDRFFFSRCDFVQTLPNLSLAQAFLHCFAYARTTHADPRLCAALDDAEVHDLFARLPLEEALAAVVAPVPLEAARKAFPRESHNWWTMGKVSRALRAAGFQTVIEQRFNSSASPHMTTRGVFDAFQPQLSLYVEAVR